MRSPSPTASELEVVKRAVQEEEIRATGKFPPEIQAMLVDSPATLRMTLKDGTYPASVAYLHRMVEWGLADYYNYDEGTFGIRICSADVAHSASLKNIDYVVFQYRARGGEEIGADQ